ncbi:hypothetical protein NIES2101_40320 [Calothrix sp. HK-06]|nr:hypothetical protein NIES2101_40320 [Calothrix sp. HK-06]
MALTAVQISAFFILAPYLINKHSKVTDSFLMMNLLSINTLKFSQVRINHPYTKTFIEAGKVYN